MRAAFYRWHAVRGRSWRLALTVLLVGGLLGAVALGAVAGARRTLSAYGRYLTSSNASDAFVNVPGTFPGMAPTRPITLISQLPGVTASAAYLGLTADPVVHGHIVDSFLTNDLTGSTGTYFSQDRMTVLAGRRPAVSSTDQIALSPAIARLFGVGVGGTVTYAFGGPAGTRPVLRTFRVTAIADIPPVLVDQSDQIQAGVLSPGATRQLLAFYQYAWVGVRLARGTGIPDLQRELAALAARLARQVRQTTDQPLPSVYFNRGGARARRHPGAVRPGRQPARRGSRPRRHGPGGGRRGSALPAGPGGRGTPVRPRALGTGGRPGARGGLGAAGGRPAGPAGRHGLAGGPAWQTSIVLILAVLIGVPLGVAAGRWAWTTFASSIGVVPAPVVPVPALVLGVLGLLAAGNLLAAGRLR